MDGIGRKDSSSICQFGNSVDQRRSEIIQLMDIGFSPDQYITDNPFSTNNVARGLQDQIACRVRCTCGPDIDSFLRRPFDLSCISCCSQCQNVPLLSNQNGNSRWSVLRVPVCRRDLFCRSCRISLPLKGALIPRLNTDHVFAKIIQREVG